jgi:hypothetical protein
MPTTQAVRTVAKVILAGPIKYWWNENWDLPLHWHYDAWREAVNAGLVADGHYLVYRPHHAWKGSWTEEAQAVNDAALAICDVFIDMTPPGIPSEGTVSEGKQVSSRRGAFIVEAPPPEKREDFDEGVRSLIAQMDALGVHRDMVDQYEVLECISWQPGRRWLIRGLIAEYEGHVFRVHYRNRDGEHRVLDANRIYEHQSGELHFAGKLRSDRVPYEQLAKIEVLPRSYD